MKPFSKDIYRPVRRQDSSLWGNSLPIQALPRLVHHSSGNIHVTPSPSLPMLPFALGHGAVGSAYQGHIHGLSTQIVAKILPADRMDHELEIWRRLRKLAGIAIPGLFGAYAVEGKDGCEDTGALVQQYAGVTLSSFDVLSHEQR